LPILRGPRFAWEKRRAVSSAPKPLQVAIDGPAASGKTTVARMVAYQLHFLYLDTGAMYRAVAFLALQTRTDADNGAALVRLCETHPISVVLDDAASLGFRIAIGERELTEGDLQSNQVTAVVSTVAAQPEVRELMVRLQREVAQDGSVVMAGRDIGTVVLPDAAVKIYLNASVAARVERRRAQLEAAGADVDAHKLAEEIEERDYLDENRAVSPLQAAPDAHEVDSSHMTAEEVAAEICRIVENTRRRLHA
jgi:cytidylate kinase